MRQTPLGQTGLTLPALVHGTSCLGNLYELVEDETKLAIVRQWFACADEGAAVALDTAGKYGAGLAIEKIGESLRRLEIDPERVVLSNKLGWFRTPLTTPEPTFERGVWAGIEHDAEQRLGYQGVLDCWEQGNNLLGAPYRPQLVSIHDPDEHLAGAGSKTQRDDRLGEVLEGYRALGELRAAGEARAVGVGAKDWRVAREIAERVDLDWVMLANSLTIHRHPSELLAFVDELVAKGVTIINSAVFNAGFLVGGRYYDYRVPSKEVEADKPLFAWREKFLTLCREHDVEPSVACVRFALSPPGVAAVAMNTSRPERVGENTAAVEADAPDSFWRAAKQAGVIDAAYPYLAPTPAPSPRKMRC
ncbi:Pyridoxal 4-dehydrogenase [Pseudobythopirellula maris]|uniref:Pyridoxal 4-dehydrogenase n=1 Tax=Pseudobythopirellula maris TaxID=2527991 RepID=A0A5C5ZU46_9BACT|nr:aldo/keto reductase [Pseudobythopirellula maris]TWT91082.1 Pyridoxal 4-dehydrogenase [Pseudobythopirellula maris]